MSKTQYPELLTAAKWDKEKGLLAKVFKGETGMGAILNELKKSYDAIPWATLDDNAMATAKAPADVEKVFNAGRATLNGPIDATRKKAIDVSRHATKVAGDLKKVTLAPKSSRELAEKISTTAVNFSVALRDEAIETLKKFEDTKNGLANDLAEAKKIGEAYMANRKLALTQMTQMKNLFIETKTRVTMLSTNADKVSKAAVAAPPTAAKAVTDITAILVDATKIVSAANDRYGREGDVSKNAVQKDARGNIDVIKGKPYLDETIKAYQTRSGADFNAIMAVVAEVLRTKTELDTMIGSIQTSLDIAKDIAGASTKTLAEHLKTAQAGVTTGTELLTKAKDELSKVQKRVPLLETQLANAKKTPAEAPGIMNVMDTSVTEAERRVGVIKQYALQLEGFKKRLAVMPPQIQAAPAMKAEVAKIDTLQKEFKLVIQQGEEGLAKIKSIRSAMPKV